MSAILDFLSWYGFPLGTVICGVLFLVLAWPSGYAQGRVYRKGDESAAPQSNVVPFKGSQRRQSERAVIYPFPRRAS